MPPSNASSSSAALIEKRLQLAEDVGEPEADEADVALLDERLDVVGGLWAGRPWRGPYVNAGRGASLDRRSRLSASQPAVVAQDLAARAQRGLELAAHLGQRVLDAHRRAGDARGARRCRAPRAPSCARKQRSERSGTACAISEKRSGRPRSRHGDDRAGPALADQLDRLVVDAGSRRIATSRGRCACRAPRAPIGHATPPAAIARGLLDRAVHRYLAGDVDHRGEGLQRDVARSPRGAARRSSRPRAPPRAGASAARPRRSTSALEVAQQRGLARVAASRTRAPARPRRCRARPAGPCARAARAPARERWCSATASAIRSSVAQRQRAVAQLGAEARVAAQRGGRAGEHAEEVRKLPAGGQRALEHGQRALRGGEVVVDVEPAHLRLLHVGNPTRSGRRPGSGKPPALLFVAFLLFISVAAPRGPRKRAHGCTDRYTRPGKGRLSDRRRRRRERPLKRRVRGGRRDEHEGDRHQQRPHGDAVGAWARRS